MFVTNKLYQLMSLEEYNKEKEQVISQLTPGYPKKTTEEKWDLLIERFQALEISTEFKQKLVSFHELRKNTSPSMFTLSLKDCTHYFEHFYFLCTTTDHRFKLNDAQKKLLLGDIDDSMESCETGSSIRFESVLQRYRTDLNWVNNLLSKQRYDLLIGMQDDYNRIKAISDAVKIHVLKSLTQLAENKELGIKIEHYVKDIFAWLLDQKDIKQYFNKHWPAVFIREYENQILDTLTQHLIFQIKDVFIEDEWNESEITFSGNKITLFSNYLKNMLSLPKVNISASLGALNEDSTCYTLKKKADIYPILRNFVQQKLINEHYFIPYEQLFSLDETTLQQVRLKAGFTFATLRAVNDTISNPNINSNEDIASVMSKHQNTLFNYPELLLTHLGENLDSLLLLPSSLKSNVCFVEATVAKLQQLLLTAIAENNEETVNRLTTALLNLVKKQPLYLKTLSPTLLAYHPLALQLVQYDGLLLQQLPGELRDNDAIVAAALTQNPKAFFYVSERLVRISDAISQQQSTLIPNTLNELLLNSQTVCIEIKARYGELYNAFSYEAEDFLCPTGIDTEEKIATMLAQLEQLEAMYELSASSLRVNTVAKLAQKLTPELFINALVKRQRNNLPPLPYGNRSAIHRFLQALDGQYSDSANNLHHLPDRNRPAIRRFLQTLDGQYSDSTTESYHSLRKKACEAALLDAYENASPDNSNIIDTLLTSTDSWFIAMIKHEQFISSFTNWKQFFLQLTIILTPLWQIIIEILSFSINMIGSYLLLELANFVAATIGLPFLLVILGSTLLGFFLAEKANNPSMMAISLMIHIIGECLLFAEVLFYLSVCSSIITSAIKIAILISDTLSASFALLTRTFFTFLIGVNYALELKSKADLYSKCEASIMRLKLCAVPSAQEKADLLETILDKIKAEIGETFITDKAREKQLAQALHKPYAISYHGKEHLFSFYQVAALSRADNLSFDISQPRSTSKFSFFKTSTAKFLPSERELQMDTHPQPLFSH